MCDVDEGVACSPSHPHSPVRPLKFLLSAAHRTDKNENENDTHQPAVSEMPRFEPIPAETNRALPELIPTNAHCGAR